MNVYEDMIFSMLNDLVADSILEYMFFRTIVCAEEKGFETIDNNNSSFSFLMTPCVAQLNELIIYLSQYRSYNIKL